MSNYLPPTENLPIFDPIVFLTGDEPLTFNTASNFFLRYPNAQGTETLQAINVNGPADFNSTVNIDGITTTTNAINMTGSSTLLNNISTRQVSLKDSINGASNGSSILTNNGVLSVDSVGAPSTNSLIYFYLRNTLNSIITPLQLTPTINNMNVSLDMTAPNASSPPVYSDAIIRSRVFGFRDLNTGSIASSSLYQTNNNSGFDILNIDSWGPSTPTLNGAIFMRTYSTTTNSLVIPLYMTKDWVRTNTVLPSNDNTNSIPTTNWIQNLLASYIPPTPSNTIKRASAAGTFTSPTGNLIFTINIPGSGGFNPLAPPPILWSQNEPITFRVNYVQNFTNRATTPFDSRNYISFSSILTIYPYRFNQLNWLEIGGVGGAPRGIMNDNQIVGSSGGNANYDYMDPPYTAAGRQFWNTNINFAANGSFGGRLYIFGSNSSLNEVAFLLTKPNGYGAANEAYSYNFSIELLNQGDNASLITSPNGWNISTF